MRRSYKFRLRPTAHQHGVLDACLTDHRRLYNAALAERKFSYEYDEEKVTYGNQSAQLTDLRAEFPEQARWSFSSHECG